MENIFQFIAPTKHDIIARDPFKPHMCLVNQICLDSADKRTNHIDG